MTMKQVGAVASMVFGGANQGGDPFGIGAMRGDEHMTHNKGGLLGLVMQPVAGVQLCKVYDDAAAPASAEKPKL